MSYEAHQDGQQADDAVYALHGRLRRMPGILPVRLQDFLHGGQSALRKVRRGNVCPSRLREGLFLCVLSCIRHATLRCANGRVLICLNTCGLLKRAAFERKKFAGGRMHTLLTCSTRIRLGALLISSAAKRECPCGHSLFCVHKITPPPRACS